MLNISTTSLTICFHVLGGLVGIASGILGAKKVTMTDLKYALPLMNENVQRNKQSWQRKDNMIICKECDWHHPPPITEFYDVILAADCIWLAQLISPLLNTLKTYTTESTKVIITYQRRGKEAHEEFWEGVHNLFDVVSVDTEKSVELAKPDVFYVLECRKKER